jgi:hypothetical protein
MENPAPTDATWQVSEVPPGSSQDRGMREEKRTDDRPAEGGTLNSGRLAPPPSEAIYLQRSNDFQLTEGVAKGAQESDLPIVVRDGNTDHTAKDQAGMQRGQSTHATGGTNTLESGVSRTLSALGIKAGKEPKHRFRSLARLLDQQLLDEAFHKLKRRAAPGIDGVTYGEYAENLEENLLRLVTRLKQGSRDDVYRRLAVNGVTGEIADRLYQHARADRIRTIRGDYSRKLLTGLGLILAAVVIFCACWFGLGFIPRILLYMCFAALGIGAWKAIDGFSDYLMAPSKTGSVADDI